MAKCEDPSMELPTAMSETEANSENCLIVNMKITLCSFKHYAMQLCYLFITLISHFLSLWNLGAYSGFLGGPLVLLTCKRAAPPPPVSGDFLLLEKGERWQGESVGLLKSLQANLVFSPTGTIAHAKVNQLGCFWVGVILPNCCPAA